MNSDTPRADAEIQMIGKVSNAIETTAFCAMAHYAHQLERELNEAKKDSKRLDWLEQTKGQMIVDTDTLIPPKWFVTDPHNKVLAHRCDSIRIAIDQAMKGEK